ncbi:MAG: heme-binding protein, partial [Pirellulales bacterium]|nr:heme-binding protein [Pirellulales bacterium]
NRSFRFVVEPRYPTGIELTPPSAANELVNDPTLNLCDQSPLLCGQVGPQSILRLPGINPVTGENLDNANPLPASVYGSADNTFSVLAFDAFNQSRNFRDPGDANVTIHGDGTVEPLANQNGIVFFPGSTPLYLDHDAGKLVGGFGVSGDGVDQDDVVTTAGQAGFDPPAEIRVDAFTLAGVRLPYQKFNRNPAL